MAEIIDGKKIAALLRSELAVEVASFIEATGVTPCLAAVLVGHDPASAVYVRSKRKNCEAVGISSKLFKLPQDTTQIELLEIVHRLNEDPQVHGILVQLPLPRQIDADEVLRAVHPSKDVDAFHPENVGLLVQGRPRFLPCTPSGVQQLLLRSGIPIPGRHVVVVGRSNIVGKPLAILLGLRGEGGDATVTLCHSRSNNMAEITRQADILIVGVGQPKLITADMVKPGATVIDVGTNRTTEGLVGDVDFDQVVDVAGYITPVPGGVGPMTIAMLLRNTLDAARGISVAP